MANIIRWEPYRELISLREAMDRLFEESFIRPRTGGPAPVEGGTLAVDMYETEDAVVVKSAIPGIEPDNLDISVTGDMLTIRGETSAEEEVREENYIRRERRYGSFCRSLAIPVPIVAEDAMAEFENGVLKLTLPKAEEVKAKAIKVKAKG